MQARLQESGKGLKSRVMSVEMLSFLSTLPYPLPASKSTPRPTMLRSLIYNTFTLAALSDSPYTTESIKALESFWKSVLLLGDEWGDYDSQNKYSSISALRFLQEKVSQRS